jgi:hypothetical protein
MISSSQTTPLLSTEQTVNQNSTDAIVENSRSYQADQQVGNKNEMLIQNEQIKIVDELGLATAEVNVDTVKTSVSSEDNTHSSEVNKNKTDAVAVSAIADSKQQPVETTAFAITTKANHNTTASDENSATDNSNSGLMCRICHCEETSEEYLITPCYCSGTLRFVHQSCLQQWLKSNGECFIQLPRNHLVY